MKIVYTNNAGNTCIVHPTPKDSVAKLLPHVGLMTDQEYINWIITKDVPQDAINLSVVQDDAIPEDRTFRNALKHDLTHDKQKCINITNDRLRRERAPLLSQLDVQFIRAQEAGKSTAEIVAEKQRLRDITKIATTEMSMAELKALKA